VGEAASVFGAVQARFLDDAITASPIVSEDRALSATLGVSFSF
jgi:outer membrane scaffolding protein for murein synthesis (MipA/OmpV family)